MARRQQRQCCFLPRFAAICSQLPLYPLFSSFTFFFLSLPSFFAPSLLSHSLRVAFLPWEIVCKQSFTENGGRSLTAAKNGTEREYEESHTERMANRKAQPSAFFCSCSPCAPLQVQPRSNRDMMQLMRHRLPLLAMSCH